MVKKFDTNPLDPEFPEKVRERETEVLSAGETPTRGLAQPTFEVEEQTRPLESSLNDFPNATDQGQVPAIPDVEAVEGKNHEIGSLSIPENVLLALPYVPIAYIGLIAGIIELIFLPRDEPRVRFHAAQGVAAHVAVFLISSVLGFLAMFTDAADITGDIFYIVQFIALVIFAIRAYQGKPIHIEWVESLTDWIDEKISPKK